MVQEAEVIIPPVLKLLQINDQAIQSVFSALNLY